MARAVKNLPCSPWGPLFTTPPFNFFPKILGAPPPPAPVTFNFPPAKKTRCFCQQIWGRGWALRLRSGEGTRNALHYVDGTCDGTPSFNPMTSTLQPFPESVGIQKRCLLCVCGTCRPSAYPWGMNRTPGKDPLLQSSEQGTVEKTAELPPPPPLHSPPRTNDYAAESQPDISTTTTFSPEEALRTAARQ